MGRGELEVVVVVEDSGGGDGGDGMNGHISTTSLSLSQCINAPTEITLTIIFTLKPKLSSSAFIQNHRRTPVQTSFLSVTLLFIILPLKSIIRLTKP